jgi:hypothetical protein
VIASECDRQLIRAAAAKVVTQNAQAIQDFLAAPRLPGRAAQ